MRHAVSLFALGLLLASGTGRADVVQNPVVERLSVDKVAVRWSDRDPVDVYVTTKPDASSKDATLVSDDDRDGTAEVMLAARPRQYLLLRDTRSGKAVIVAERLVPLVQGSNFRDIGGYSAADGKHVRWGMIYRSGATPLLTDTDRGVVASLRLANLIDLRSNEERVLAPGRIDGVPYSAVGYSMADMMPTDPSKLNGRTMGSLYREFPTFLAPQLRIVFAKLLDREGPVAYNCSAGQDRTGFVTAMILSALGASRETIIADYHLSTTYRRPEYEMPKIDLAAHAGDPVAKLFAQGQQHPGGARPQPLKSADGTAYLSEALTTIEQRWGSIDAYLAKEIGVDEADITLLRQTYLE